MRRLGLIVLGVAIILGGFAVFGMIGLMKGRNSANMAQIVVAARSLEFGQALTPDALRLQTWPADSVPEGAFTQISELTSGDQRVAIRAIEANEPILMSRISGAGGRATLSAQIAEGHRAVAIRVNDVVGVAGFVLPGDVVDVLLTRQEGSGYNNNQQMRTDLLIERVRVLAVDQTASESRNDPQVARAVTIEVTPEDSQKIALASEIGTLSLSLRRADDVAPDAPGAPGARTIRIEDLRAEHEGRVVATAAPAPRTRARPRAAQPAGPSIEITRGFTTNRATVSAE